MSSIRIPDQIQINEWLDDLFSPVVIGSEEAQYGAAVSAFEELTGYYIYISLAKKRPEMLEQISQHTRVDYTALICLLKRFQRDTYGLGGFRKYLKRLIKRGDLRVGLDEEIMGKIKTEEEIMDFASNLGLHISNEDPLKTRVAAAFSLWMCVFRPVWIDSKMPDISATALEQFCAGLNLWLACSFLLKFGEVTLGKGKEGQLRRRRITHDFTYRNVSLPILEMLYDSIYRERQRKS